MINLPAIGRNPTLHTIDDNRRFHLELVFYVYMFISAFLHVFVNIPGLAFAMILGIGTLAAFYRMQDMSWTALPATMVTVMFIMDAVEYDIQAATLAPYIVWVVVFSVFLVLHQDPAFFRRAKVVFFLYLLAHLYYASPDPADPTRISLVRDAPPRFGITNSNELAYWCGFGVLSSLVAFWSSKNLNGIWYLATAGLSVVYLLATVSRSGLLVTIIAVAIYFIGSYRRMTPGLVLATVMGTLLIAGVFHERILDGIQQYQVRDEQEDSEGGFSGRVALNEEGLRVFMESFVYGTGKNEISAPGVDKPKPPHNAFLSIGVHYGFLPTVLLFSLWMITICKAAWLAYGTFTGRPSASEVDGWELFAFSIFGFLAINMATLSEIPFYTTLYMSRILSAK